MSLRSLTIDDLAYMQECNNLLQGGVSLYIRLFHELREQAKKKGINPPIWTTVVETIVPQSVFMNRLGLGMRLPAACDLKFMIYPSLAAYAEFICRLPKWSDNGPVVSASIEIEHYSPAHDYVVTSDPIKHLVELYEWEPCSLAESNLVVHKSVPLASISNTGDVDATFESDIINFFKQRYEETELADIQSLFETSNEIVKKAYENERLWEITP
jgi:hypothetical protein